jgi:hypothetical protein
MFLRYNSHLMLYIFLKSFIQCKQCRCSLGARAKPLARLNDKKRRKGRKVSYFVFSMAITDLIAIMTAAGATNATM